MGEVVKGVDILQKMALFQIPDAGGSTAGIQRVGYGICSCIERVIVHTFIYADAPQDDAGVIPVLQDHFLHHFACQILPAAISDVLPARQFGKYQQACFITGVQKVPALRIVAGTHRVAAQLLLQNTGILPLQAFRRRIADIGIALVPVQAPQERLFPVQIEAIRLKNRRAEAETGLPDVQNFPLFIQQRCLAAVQHRIIRRPGHRLRILQNGVNFRLRRKRFVSQRLPCRVFQGKPHLSGSLRLIQLQADICRLQSRRMDKQIFHPALGRRFQPDLPVQSAIGQVVDHKAEGRHLGILPGVQTNREQVPLIPVHQIGNLQGKRRITAPVLPRPLSVDKHHRLMGRAVKSKEKPGSVRRDREASAVAADHLIVSGGSVVQRHLPAGMGQTHRLRLHGFSPQKGFGAGFREFPGIAQTVLHRFSSSWNL